MSKYPEPLSRLPANTATIEISIRGDVHKNFEEEMNSCALATTICATVSFFAGNSWDVSSESSEPSSCIPSLATIWLSVSGMTKTNIEPRIMRIIPSIYGVQGSDFSIVAPKGIATISAT
jgi:hypothetical protein